MVLTGHNQKAAQAADGTGQQHSTDHHAADIDAGIAGGVFTLAHNADLVPLLGVFEVSVHRKGQHQHHNNIDGVALAVDHGQPASLGGFVQGAQAGCLAAHDIRHAGHNAGGNVVHHQGEQRFVGVPAGFEPGRNKGPDGTGQHTADDHGGKQQRCGQAAAKIHHDKRRDQAADQHLAFAADVPKAHLKGGSQCNGNAQQAGKITQRPRETGGVHKRAVPHNAVHADGVQAGNKKDEERIHNKCQQDSNGTHQHFLHKGGTLPLGDTHKRFSCSFAHHLPSFCTRLVMRRPTSSLVVVRASSMPLALPPHSTRMRSHSSSRTSRSSPT